MWWCLRLWLRAVGLLRRTGGFDAVSDGEQCRTSHLKARIGASTGQASVLSSCKPLQTLNPFPTKEMKNISREQKHLPGKKRQGADNTNQGEQNTCSPDCWGKNMKNLFLFWYCRDQPYIRNTAPMEKRVSLDSRSIVVWKIMQAW